MPGQPRGLVKSPRSQGSAEPAGRGQEAGGEGCEEGRAARSCAAASAQVQGWKLPDRRAEHASSLPPSLPPAPCTPAGSGGSPAQTGPPLPDDALGGTSPAGALPEGSRARPEPLVPEQQQPVGLGLHRLCVHSKARSLLPSEDPAALHVRTDPSSQPHSTAPTPAALQEPQLVVPPARSPQPWGCALGVSQPPEPEGPCPQGSTAAQPRAGCALLGDLSMCQLCRVPCPGHEAGHVLTRPSLCSSHSSPSPPSPKQQLSALTVGDHCSHHQSAWEGRPVWHLRSAQHGLKLLCRRSWSQPGQCQVLHNQL